MTTRTKAAGERGNRHLSGKHKVTGTRKPAVAHVKDLSAPRFTQPAVMPADERARVHAVATLTLQAMRALPVPEPEPVEDLLAYFDDAWAKRMEREGRHE